jgi:tRNA threonylcarbamoyladenosine biosynthesis protein TsaE
MEIGQALGGHLSEGDVVGLTGVLGSGKSVMARGIMRALGIEGEIPSPSFIMVATYEAKVPVNHIDLYRLTAAVEAVDLGLEDLLYSQAISIVEWAEKIGGILPDGRIDISLDVRESPEERLITVKPSDDSMKSRLLAVAKELIRLG